MCCSCYCTGSNRRGEPKQVMFSDGIRPGGDLTELDGSNEVTRVTPRRSRNRVMQGNEMLNYLVLLKGSGMFC